MPLPSRHGLYEPTLEHDACGLGFVALSDHIAALPRDPMLARRTPEERIAFASLSAFRLLDVDAVCAAESGTRPALRALCSELVANMQRLSDALSGSYLAPATLPLSPT